VRDTKSYSADPSKEGRILFWIGIIFMVFSPLLIFSPSFGALLVIPFIILGLILIILGDRIWKEARRLHVGDHFQKPQITYVNYEKDRNYVIIGLILLLFGPFLSWVSYFVFPPRDSFEGSFPLMLIGIVMFPMGLSLIYFGFTSMDQTALASHGIPEEYFLWVQKGRLYTKTIQIGVCLITIYAIIFLLFILPVIIEYNEFWADGHSGARSPFGSGGECCSLILIALFFVFFIILRTALKYKMKRDFIKGLGPQERK
jgi:hypothetical protein